MSRKVFWLLIIGALALVLAVSAVSAQEGEPLRIGLLTDQSGPLTIYGYELEYGFRLGLLYATGVDPAEYDYDLDAALAAASVAGRPIE
ncbi:MAG: hypothetical protein NZM00_01610, partial [Anaerolinea sp.]|nr:hypothetical protein [Anaerolinea sp.]